jgi:hypothetical protein
MITLATFLLIGYQEVVREVEVRFNGDRENNIDCVEEAPYS